MKEINEFKDEFENYFFPIKKFICFYLNVYGRTKLSNDFFEKKLRVNAITQNWKTVNKLLNIAKSLSK